MVVGVSNAVGAASTHPAVRMPDLIGLDRVEVYRVMRHDGLFFATHGPGSNVDRWVAVTAQSPRPGTAVPWHGEVNLSVTNVSPTGPRPMPDLVGKSRAQVYALMRRAQLYFETVGPGSTNGTWIEAVAQSVRPGVRVPWHGEVKVRVIDRRPAPKPTTAAAKATVANPVVPVPSGPVALDFSSGPGFKVGIATWYNYVPGRCATWYLPKGTVLTVEDLATGRSISCVISDRESVGDDHVVDLSETQFSELAPLGEGVIRVKVSW